MRSRREHNPRWRPRHLVAIGSLLALGVLPVAGGGAGVAAAAAADTTEHLSLDVETGGGRELPATDASGRWVVFVGRSSAAWGVYVHDRVTHTSVRRTSGNHVNPAISGDGSTIAYVVYGSTRSVYVAPRAGGAATLVSKASDGTPADGLSDYPSLSSDGRYVAFQSTATNLASGSSSGGPNKVYVHDRVTGTTQMVSVDNAGNPADGNATRPAITPDGRYVAFASDAANLSAAAEDGEETTVSNIFVRDRLTNTTAPVSVGPGGVLGDGASATTYGPTISSDGRFVAFESTATNLVATDTNGVVSDVFVHDRQTGVTSLVSVTSDEAQVAEDSNGGMISGNGRWVAFESVSASLTTGDTNGVKDVFVRDLVNGTTERVSLANPDGTEASGTRIDGNTGLEVPQINGADATINRDGSVIAFTTNGDLTGDRPEETEEGSVSAAAVSTEPATYARVRDLGTPSGGYVLDGWGGLHRFGDAAPAGSSYWPGWDIARGIAVAGSKPSGYLLDAFGALHRFGGAPAVPAPAYWPGWDIARGVALNPDGTSGYTVDGFGGLHPFGGAKPVSSWYSLGNDIVRGVALTDNSTAAAPAGYTVDGYGGVHAFGAAPPVTAGAMFPGWDIVNGLALDPDGIGGYTVDGWGGLHPFGGAQPVTAGAYFPGWDIVRSVSMVGGPTPRGYTVDGWGGIHEFGGAAAVSTPAYWPGWDIVRGIASR